MFNTKLTDEKKKKKKKKKQKKEKARWSHEFQTTLPHY